jgi:glycosyltransferase involved in cell wall biosynthesis
MNLKASVIICTLNRARQLRAAVFSVMMQSFPWELFEIVVVDNGSTDGTREVVEECRRQSIPSIVYVHEPNHSLSEARNRGILTAKGDVLAFMDDDARADSSWLLSLVEALEGENGPAAAGGPIYPLNRIHLPDWLPDRLTTYFSIVDYGRRDIELNYPRLPFGTNMAFKRTIFERVGSFRADLGRKGACSFFTGEETELFVRIARSGDTIQYTPRAIIYHDVDPKRLQPAWLYRQAFWIGVSFAITEREHRMLLRMVMRILISPVLLTLGAGVWMMALAIPDRTFAVYCGCVLMDHCGYLQRLLRSLVPHDATLPR